MPAPSGQIPPPWTWWENEAPAARAACSSSQAAGRRYARWGEQLDVRNITRTDDQAGELSAEQVAGYIAKYATKATESFGSDWTAGSAPTTWST
jgi:hypothetical protein